MHVSSTTYSLLFHDEMSSVVIKLFQELDNCLVMGNTAGYIASCSSGTNNTSDTKVYTLEIENVRKIDLVTWWCSLGKTQSNKFNLSSTGKLLSIG